MSAHVGTRLTGSEQSMSANPSRARFQAVYEGKPPWDIGRPQQPFVAIADQVTGPILDVGCGTGEIALFFAARGHAVLGIDFVDVAIQRAGRKADARGVRADFLQWDALQLDGLNRTFDQVIDCGLFHTLSDEDRIPYVAGLACVTQPGGRVFLMCFSDEEPGDEGPRRVSQREIRTAFAHGWVVESISAARFEPNPESPEHHFSAGGPKAWFAVIRRVLTFA